MRSAPSSGRPTRTWRAPCPAIGRPVTGNADIGIERNDQRPSSLFEGETKPRGYGVDAVQPIFSGFRTYYAVNTEEANVRAGRETLRDVERRCSAGRDGLHGRGPRPGARPAAREQRQRSDPRVESDAGSILRRRGDAHRRRPGSGPPRRCRVGPGSRPRQPRTSRGSYERVIGHPPSG